MTDKNMFEAAKTASLLVGGVISGIGAMIILNYMDFIDFRLDIDPGIMTLFLGAFLASGLAVFYLDQID